LFCYCQSIIHFDAEISDRAFDFGVAEQQLLAGYHRAGKLELRSSPERMGAEDQLTSLLEGWKRPQNYWP
jgi:hypothetical protein